MLEVQNRGVANLLASVSIRDTKTDGLLMNRLRDTDEPGPYSAGLSEAEVLAFAELPQRQLYLLLREVRRCIADGLYEPDLLSPGPKKAKRPFEVKGSYGPKDIQGFIEDGTGRPGSKARLPDGHFRLFDRITQIEDFGGNMGRVEAEFDLSPGTWFFDEHLPGNPLMAGSSQKEGLAQLAGFFGAWILASKGLLDGFGMYIGSMEERCCGKVTPENKLVRYDLTVKYRITSKGVLTIADGMVSADGETTFLVKAVKTFVEQA